MDKLKQIEAFVAATDGGSLAKAALKAQVTPVMIGRRIDALERRLGVRLLHRSTRRLALTEEGATYLEQCRRLLADLDHVESLLGGGRHRALPRRCPVNDLRVSGHDHAVRCGPGLRRDLRGCRANRGRPRGHHGARQEIRGEGRRLATFARSGFHHGDDEQAARPYHRR